MRPLRTFLRPLHRLRRRVLLHRRPLAALTAAGAVLAALPVLSPPPPRTVAVWTARHDLPSGTVLEQADLTRVWFAPGTVPRHVVRSPRELVGRALAAPMAGGEPVTRLRLVASGLMRGYPGRTAVPLRVTDAAVAELLRVGDRASFVVADPEGRTAPRVLLEDAPVVAVPAAAEGLDTGVPGRIVVVAVPRQDAGAVAASAATSILIPVWDR